MFVDKIFERATIQGIADYLLFGMGPDQDNRSYEERLDEPYMRFEKAVEKLFFVKYFSLKKASKFPVFVKGFSLLLAGIDYASRRMRACSIR